MEASSLTAPLCPALAPVASGRLNRCSDEELVERFRAGRDDAFRVIHDRYRQRLGAYVRQMLTGRSSEDVEDVLQDVFERAARTLATDGAPTGLRAWLYSVARNRCIDELRRRPPASPDVLAASRLPAGDTGAVAERRADVERLFRDLRALPELQRSALLMRELQGLTHVELGLVLDTTVPAVKSLLVRARDGLVDAEAARGVACATIRDALAGAHDRRVKASKQAARHLRECTACRSYRQELRRTSRRLAGLVPGPTFFPLAVVQRLLGGSGAHAPAVPAATSGLAGSGGVAIAGAGKIAALLSAAAVVTTGAVLERSGALRGVLAGSAPVAVHDLAGATGRGGGPAGSPPAGRPAVSSGPGSPSAPGAAASGAVRPVVAGSPAPGAGGPPASAAGASAPPANQAAGSGQPAGTASSGSGSSAAAALPAPGSVVAGAGQAASRTASALPVGAAPAVVSGVASGATGAASGATGAASGATGAASGATGTASGATGAAASGTTGALSGAAGTMSGAAGGLPGPASGAASALPSPPAVHLPPVPAHLGGVLP